MGTVLSKGANAIGGVLGNAFVAPFKTIFGGSCEGVCAGPWDVICFIEHLCVSNLVKLLMILGLCYLTLLFLYLLFKVGICQCIVRSLCRMCWAACETYWFALEDMSCFLWHKLKNTKRVNRRHRRRFQDIERGYSSSSSESDFSDNYHHLGISRKRKSMRGHGNNRRFNNHNHVRLKTREVSVHVKGRSRRRRNSRRLQVTKARNPQRDTGLFKRRRFR